MAQPLIRPPARSLRDLRAVPPGPREPFFVGSIGRLRGPGAPAFLESLRRDYGDIAYLHFLGTRVYSLHHPDYIHQALVKDAATLEKSPALKNATRKSIGTGLLTSDGELHRQQRKLIQPAFHAKRIAAYADTMVSYAQRALKTWPENAARDVHHEMMELTMQIVAKTLFDADVTQEASELGEAISAGISDTMDRMLNPLHLPDWVPTQRNRYRRQMAQRLDDLIVGFIRARRASGEDVGDLLSMLALSVGEDGQLMDETQARHEALTLFVAGHETTAVALTWTLYLLAQHPHVEQKLRAELAEVLAGRAPSMTDLPRLRYTDWVVKESMRLYPPAWVTTRWTTQPLSIGGYHVPRHSLLMLSPWVMQRHPDYWEAPEAFQPERFAREDEISRYVYFPFGGGPRICIGNSFAQMEAALVLATLLQEARFTLEPDQQVVLEPLITLRPKGGIRMCRAAVHPSGEMPA